MHVDPLAHTVGPVHPVLRSASTKISTEQHTHSRGLPSTLPEVGLHRPASGAGSSGGRSSRRRARGDGQGDDADADRRRVVIERRPSADRAADRCKEGRVRRRVACGGSPGEKLERAAACDVERKHKRQRGSRCCCVRDLSQHVY